MRPIYNKDWDRVWNSSDPEVPVCLQDSVLAWTPSAVLALISAFYLPYLVSFTAIYTCRQKSHRHIAKLVGYQYIYIPSCNI